MWSVSALVTALWIEDLSGYMHRKTAISTEFSQLRSTATGSYSNFGLDGDPDGQIASSLAGGLITEHSANEDTRPHR
jgi:hypothetical protein